ncbi:MAG: glycosyltransferase family 1 protein [Bacteroidia bacterium]
MKIGINARLLVDGKMDGIGWFAYETLRRIVELHPEHQFIYFFDRLFHDKFITSNNITPVVLQPQARHPLLWYLFFEFSIPRALNKYRPDLFFSPDGFLSLNTRVPSVSVLHDLAYEHFPEQVPYLGRKFYRYYMPRYARKAVRLGTVSEYSKQEIARHYHIDPAKIDVVYNGANKAYGPVAAEVQEMTRKKYTRGAPYFIFIGGMYPRKNLKRLLLGFNEFKQHDEQGIKLLVIGRAAYKSDEIMVTHEAIHHKEDVYFLGRINGEEEVRNLLASAMAMTYVSLFEGFGIPVLEAMRSGVPVITSRSSSLPEVAGEAAVYCDPFSINDIAAAMQKVAEDPELRQKMSKMGFEQEQKFSWDRSARLLWQCIEKSFSGLPNLQT